MLVTTHGPLILAAGSMLDVPADILVDVAADAGFDGVGLRLSAEHGSGDLRALRARAERYGIVVHDTEVHRIDTGATDPGVLIERSVAVGASALLVVSDLADRARTRDALGHLTDRCHRAGLEVALEYMAWTTPSTPADAVAMAREVGCVLVVDVLHHVRVGAGRTELDEVVDRGVLGWVQLCDAPASATGDLVHEARHGRLPPGHGALPLVELLASVPTGTPISVEVQSDELRRLPPAERARLLHDTARSVLAGSR
jgi:sugar phosphate isomerase/epimerase